MVKQPVTVNGVVRWRDMGEAHMVQPEKEEHKMVVLRHEIGDVLRDVRQRQGRTLREVSHSARVSLGYLSEVERGQKEASSELLSSICVALEIPLSLMLREVSERVALAEGIAIPDTVPTDMANEYADKGNSKPLASVQHHFSGRRHSVIEIAGSRSRSLREMRGLLAYSWENYQVKISDFWRNMENEFGPRYSHVLADSTALTELGSLTAAQALDQGVKPKQVWEALCRAQDVPAERWLGVDIEPKQS